MCGIIGIFHADKAVEKVKTALALLEKRGKDNADYLKINDSSVVGHTLHAVVNTIPQPLQRHGILTANCEIYNWQELSAQYQFTARNDADFLVQFLDAFGIDKVAELDGVYAFAYVKDDKVILVRDLIGEKPLWFSYTADSFGFASEKKVLEKLNYIDLQELNPRQILQYNLKTKTLSFIPRAFFSYLPEHRETKEAIKEKAKLLLNEAIAKRVPATKFGLLFSGGIDSTFLAHYLKKQGYAFTCYTAVLDTGDKEEAPDLTVARKVAMDLGLTLKIKKIKQDDVPALLHKIVPLIEDSNVVKVGVALPFFSACELAKEDSCKVIFSGLGSEEIFAGYQRHQQSANINQECLFGLLKMYERDLYRDDVITMANHMELRLPFLDQHLIEYALKIPAEYKIQGEKTKLLLREIAVDEGIPQEYAFRKKMAAQYGSRFDSALGKLAKKMGFPSKSAYLKTFFPHSNLKLAVLFSTGKDSLHAAYIMQQQNYELTCLVHLQSANKDSYMFQTAGTELAALQAEAMRLPIIVQKTSGEKEKELQDLEIALIMAKEKYNVDGIVSGALFSTYQRDRIEKIGDKLGLKLFAPLWHKPQQQQMQELLKKGFQFVFSAVAAEGLDHSWLNKLITAAELEKLQLLSQKVQFNVAGEGGETESLVLDCPLFFQKIILQEVEIKKENKNTARLIVHKAVLVEK